MENPTETNNQLIEKLNDVPILFADIAGFTKYSSSVSPSEVVLMLRKLFTEFDKLCLNYDLYKLYTIGDCYVVMGFSDANNRNLEKEVINLISMAFDMVDIINNVRQNIQFEDLNMRIGIHIVYYIFYIFLYYFYKGGYYWRNHWN